MRFGLIATRLSGTEGVSREVARWVRGLQRLDHEVFYCAGELGGYAARGTLIPLDGFVDDRAVEQVVQLIQSPKDASAIVDRNFAIASEHFSLETLENKLKQVLASFRPSATGSWLI
jgi:hypothetical protein